MVSSYSLHLIHGEKVRPGSRSPNYLLEGQGSSFQVSCLSVAGPSAIMAALQLGLLSMEGEAFEMALKDGRALTFGDGVEPDTQPVARRRGLRYGSGPGRSAVRMESWEPPVGHSRRWD